MILDLTNKTNSDIDYHINEYPDGQKDIIIKEIEDEKSVADFQDFGQGGSITTYKLSKPPVVIKSRLNNMEDMGLIICAAQALKNKKVKEIHLYIPYIMGLRSDRLFVEGGIRYIKDVLAPLINSQNFESVTCIDPHSDVAQNCINNFYSIDNAPLVKFALEHLYRFQRGQAIKGNFQFFSPDAGASKKIYKVAEKLGYHDEIIVCGKDRDENGKLTKTIIPDNWHFDKDIIIIDDICDGGGTFINLAKAIKETGLHKGKMYLVVTHGIFSKGLKELNEIFDGAFTTDSYRNFLDIKNEWVMHNEKKMHKLYIKKVFDDLYTS